MELFNFFYNEINKHSYINPEMADTNVNAE